MLRRISVSGLKGRPRQTLVLLTTMILSFFFVTLAMNLLSTSQINRAIQRREAYGEWSNVFIADRPELAQTLQAKTTPYATNRILGRDQRLGVVAAAGPDFWSMSNIKLLEGRLPEALDEIVMTESQISYFSEKPAIGDTITVTFHVASSEHETYLFDDDLAKLVTQDLVAADRYLAEHWSEIHQRILSAQTRWQQQKLSRIEEHLALLSQRPVVFDRAEETDRFVRLNEARFDRALALFEDDGGSLSERLERIENFHRQETEHLIEEMVSDPTSRLQFPEAETEQALRQSITNHLSFDNQVMAYVGRSSRRNTSELEAKDATLISTRGSYRLVRYQPDNLARFSSLYRYLPSGGIDGIPAEREFPAASEIVLHRDMRVSGIIANYHQVWDGPFTQYATAFVSPETGEQLFERGLSLSKVESNRLYQPPVHYFIRSTEPVAFEQAYPQALNLFSNQLGFGQDSSISEDSLSLILLGVITLVTAFSLFQISLIQFRKRLRKLALMRAIGATFQQLRHMLTWEAIYLITLALPIGGVAGFLSSYVLLWLNNRATGDSLILRLNPSWLILGYGLTLLSILIGLFIPMLRIKQVPLRGKLETTDQRVLRSTRQRLGRTDGQPQSLSSINRRHRRFIRKQQLIQLGLMSAIILILIGSYLMIYLAFGDYREKTVHAHMPDFELEAPFQQSLRLSKEFMEEIERIPGVSRTELFVRGIKTYMYYPGVNEGRLHDTFRRLIPSEMVTEHYGTTEEFVIPEEDRYLIDQAAVTDVYGIVAESELEQAMVRMLGPDFDRDAFRREQQAILLLPGYHLEETQPAPIDPARLETIDRANRMKQVLELSGAGSISYDIRRSPVMTKPVVKSIDRVELSVPLGATFGESNVRTNHVRRYRLPVARVIHHLPEEGFWPLSDSVQNPILFVSQSTMDDLYPYKMHVMLSFDLIFRYKGDEPAIRFGSSIIQVDQTAMDEAGVAEIKRLGFTNGFQVKSLYLQKQQLYTKGIRTSLIIGLLAGTLLLIAIQIQTGTFRGQLEVERERIGILQSLGVTEKDFRRTYLKEAIQRVLQAIGLVHIVVLVGLLGYVVINGRSSNILTELKIALWDYNWWWHGGILIVFSLLGVLATYLPVGQILKRQPVNNIRSLN